MKKTAKNIIAILCAALLAASLFAGCDGRSAYERSRDKLNELEQQYEAINKEIESLQSKASTTIGQQNALKSAKSYLNTGMGFSKKGLEDQLDYEGFSSDEISYAISNCGADWMDEAVKSAENYLRTNIGFSRSSLIDQLKYEGFTHEQAVYGVEQNGY